MTSMPTIMTTTTPTLNPQIHLDTNAQTSSNSTSSSSTYTSHHSKIVEPANLRIKETRIDANEIISQIELELANRLLLNSK
jgi:hypothetical protein